MAQDKLTRDQKLDRMYDVLVGEPEFGRKGLVHRFDNLDTRVTKIEDDKRKDRSFRRGMLFGSGVGGGAIAGPYLKTLVIKLIGLFTGAVPFLILFIIWELR